MTSRNSTERKRQWRLDNPMKCAYQTLKYNAKRRGKIFTLTFEEFEKFAIITELLTCRGKKPTSYSVDRIDPDKGYTFDNIQKLTISENSSKKNTRSYYWDEYDMQLKITTKRPTEDESHPF